jgi:hypothetical protein
VRTYNIACATFNIKNLAGINKKKQKIYLRVLEPKAQPVLFLLQDSEGESTHYIQCALLFVLQET